MFAYTIAPVLTTTLVNILEGVEFIGYAGNSSVPVLAILNQSQAGLSYSYSGDPTFSGIYPNYLNQRFLRITYSDFMNAGGSYN